MRWEPEENRGQHNGRSGRAGEVINSTITRGILPFVFLVAP